MTKKEFKAAMLRGLGRCVTAVQQDPEKYRDAILWACKRDIAYDAQCEGTRSWYVYALASAYPDKEPFICAAAESLKKYHPKGGWDLLHLSELLMFFAMDGYDSARKAVVGKYRELLAGISARKRRRSPVFYELSDLEQLGLILATNERSFLRIAADFGHLYREKQYLYDGEFCWFFSEKGNQYRKELEYAAKTNEDIACFLRREQADIAAQEEYQKQRQTLSPETYTGVRLSRWLTKVTNTETLKQYASAYRNQLQPNPRAHALSAFLLCPYPDDPQPIIEDTKSACEELRNAAWRALENIRHPTIRAFAISNVASGMRTPENFALLVRNYMHEDADLMEKLLRELIAAKDWDCVHAAGMNISRTFRKESSIPHPKHLLPLLYEYDPCSYCRESLLMIMSKRRMLTKAILEECQYDSNEDIRRYARKRLKP